MAEEENDPQTGGSAPSSNSGAEAFIEKHQRTIMWVVVLIVGAFAAYFGYKKLHLEPQNQEAKQEMWKAQYYFGADSLRLAMDGDPSGYPGFRDLVEEYGGTKAGELAEYYLAVSLLRSGNFQEAAKKADEVSTENEILAALASGVAGDAFVEAGEREKGIARFKKAASLSDNALTRPLYLKKAGLTLEAQGQYQEAIETYKKIRKKHPDTPEGEDIEKYIARAEAYL